MNCSILGRIEGCVAGFVCRRLRSSSHYGIIKFISTTIQKLKGGYKPLGVAVFLAVGGLLSGLMWSSFFASIPAGTVQERRISGGAEFIPQAEGAEVDSAALMPESAPFLASASAGVTRGAPLAENVDVLYGEGAVKDLGRVIQTQTTALVATTPKPLTSGVIYTVAKGDTLSSISAAFDVPIDIIVEFNPSVNFSSLVPGISIVIPSEASISAFSG